MPIRFRCPQCRQLSGIATRKAGMPVQCPRCEARIIVPSEDMAEAAWDPAGPESGAAPDEDDWGRVRWESDEAWDDDALIETPADENESAGASEGKRTAKTTMIPPPPRSPTGTVVTDEGDEEITFRPMKSDVAEMDLTPMVDCTFLLLIFFMITASFSLQKTIEVPPPNPDKKGAAQSLQTLDDFKEDSIIVEIDERNAILIDDEPLAALASLPQVLSNKMLLEKKTELMLMAHDKAWHEIVVAVIDSANEVGMQRIRMAAHGGNDD